MPVRVLLSRYMPLVKLDGVSPLLLEKLPEFVSCPFLSDITCDLNDVGLFLVLAVFSIVAML